ncbi:3-hydroxyacyl-CoA dehydrogenase [Microbacterium sp. 5K110]|uniref:3-hydroxyacyl-CoA dehydrogenase n=1 Tax=unclassified Microbacterium TaxID=2609290 RepID=UPI001BB19912|nr:3-hydroxyacyl-CoA dehydrogenase [Microbacterium sp. 5K110]
MSARPVAIVGSGAIGVAFAVLFARAGRPAAVFDIDEAALERGRADVRARLRLLADAGLLDEEPPVVAARIGWHTDAAAAARDAELVQECAPERADLKRDVLSRFAAVTPADAILASSTSAIAPSILADGLAPEIAARVVVGHPGNPPYLLPVIEVVPSPVTASGVVDRAADVYRSAGLRPVLLRREIEGFVFNRLQGALLREAYCLVRDGIVDAADVDEVVRSGLGRRWSIIGPFETSDLNVRGGIAAHAERMGASYARMGAERGQHDPWTPDLVARVEAERRAALPLEDWDERVRWRDARLMALTPLWDAAS